MSLEETIARVVEETVRRVMREEAARSGPEVLSTEEAAKAAHVTRKTIRAWIDAGKLPAGRRGRLRTVARADLERLLAGERPESPSSERLLRRIG